MTSADDREATTGGGATRLTGGRLLAARVAWLIGVGITLAVFATSIRDYLESMRHPGLLNAALPPRAVAALQRAGVSLGAYAWASLVVILLITLVSLALALVLFWRRGDDWMALLVSVFILSYTTANIGVPTNPAPIQGWSVGAAFTVFWGALTFGLWFGVLLVFPSGRFAPRWSLWFLVVATLWAGVWGADSNLLGGALVLGYPLFVGGEIAFMVYRYRRVATPMQQLQTRWVIAALVATLIANQVFWLPTGFTPLGETIYPPLAYTGYQLVLGLVPVVFFIAIQRYHLYNIDTIINRALVYGSLTVVLGALYFGLITGAQALIHLLRGQQNQSQLSIVLSTLAVAALIQPLRRRLQAIIDQRFYRRKYDATRTLEVFGATLRSEIELGELSERLVAIVQETMRPASIWLWLRPAPRNTATPHHL